MRSINNINSLLLSRITGNTPQQEARPTTTSHNLIRQIRIIRYNKYLGKILRLDSTRLLHRALAQTHQLGLKGSLLMDAPQHSSFQDLREQAMDKATWNARIRGFQWINVVDLVQKKRSWLLTDNQRYVWTVWWRTQNRFGRLDAGRGIKFLSGEGKRGEGRDQLYILWWLQGDWMSMWSTGLNVNVGLGSGCQCGLRVWMSMWSTGFECKTRWNCGRRWQRLKTRIGRLDDKRMWKTMKKGGNFNKRKNCSKEQEEEIVGRSNYEHWIQTTNWSSIFEFDFILNYFLQSNGYTTSSLIINLIELRLIEVFSRCIFGFSVRLRSYFRRLIFRNNIWNDIYDG